MHWTHGRDWIGELLNSCHGLTSRLHDAALLFQGKLYMGYAGGAKEWREKWDIGSEKQYHWPKGRGKHTI